MREEERRAFGLALRAMRGLNARLGTRTRDAVAAAIAATLDEAATPPDAPGPKTIQLTEPPRAAPVAASLAERAPAVVALDPIAPARTEGQLDASLHAPVAALKAVTEPPPAPTVSAFGMPDVPEPQSAEPAVHEPVTESVEVPAFAFAAALEPASLTTEPVPTPAVQAAAAMSPPAGASTASSALASVTPLRIAAATLAGATSAAPAVFAPAETDSVDPLIDVRDEVDEQVMPLFLEEAQELFPAATEQARMMRAAPADAAARAAIKRTLHTLKGSARMAGAMRLGEITHLLETRIIEAPAHPGPEFFDAVDEALDDVAFLLDRHSRDEHNVILPRYRTRASVEKPEHRADAPSEPASSQLAEADAPAVAVEPKPAPASGAAASTVPEGPVAAAAALSATPAALAGAAVAPAATMAETAFLRVRSDALETLADEAGEIAIARARIESELRDLKTGLLDLTSAVIRLRTQLRELEIQGETQIQSRLDTASPFDPLEFDRYTRFQELTRSLAEAANDVATVQQNLLKNLADAESSLAAQMRLSRAVQLRLQSMRTVPFATVSDRLYRVLRQTAKELGKRANLDIRGGRIEIDRSVLERLAPVIEHLVRNALAHGIERAVERERAGKPITGELVLAVAQQGNEVVIELTDDGAGLPLAKIEARARALGLLAPDARVSEAELVELIFHAGFSTADAVSAIAGRGVGMDVVRSEVTALGGRVEVRTQAGRGTSFVLRVPLTLAVTQVLLVRTGDTAVGIPASLIETVRQVRTTECDAARLSGRLLHAGTQIPYFVLSSLYDKTPSDVADQRTRSVAILRSGDLVAAFELEAVIGNQEVVAKPYGPQLARVRGFAGLTVLGDGSIVILSNPLQLMPSAIVPEQERAVRAATLATQTGPTVDAGVPLKPTTASAPSVESAVADVARPDMLPPTATSEAKAEVSPVAAEVISIRPDIAAQPSRTPLVLVVDDSLTVRKITTRLLE
ncbi:MAG: ATP-binding protein, partial [Casimicrobiaceae bacterium]